MSNLDSIIAIVVLILGVLGLVELILVVHIIPTRLAIEMTVGVAVGVAVGKAVGKAIGEAISRMVAGSVVGSYRTVVWCSRTIIIRLGFDHNAGDFLFSIFVGDFLVFFFLATRLDVGWNRRSSLAWSTRLGDSSPLCFVQTVLWSKQL